MCAREIDCLQPPLLVARNGVFACVCVTLGGRMVRMIVRDAFFLFCTSSKQSRTKELSCHMQYIRASTSNSTEIAPCRASGSKFLAVAVRYMHENAVATWRCCLHGPVAALCRNERPRKPTGRVFRTQAALHIFSRFSSYVGRCSILHKRQMFVWRSQGEMIGGFFCRG